MQGLIKTWPVCLQKFTNIWLVVDPMLQLHSCRLHVGLRGKKPSASVEDSEETCTKKDHWILKYLLRKIFTIYWHSQWEKRSGCYARESEAPFAPHVPVSAQNPAPDAPWHITWSAKTPSPSPGVFCRSEWDKLHTPYPLSRTSKEQLAHREQPE